jgi:hypothetical protein
MTWDVACTAWIRILPPNASIPSISINDLDFIKWKGFLADESAGLDNACNSSSNDDSKAMLVLSF